MAGTKLKTKDCDDIRRQPERPERIVEIFPENGSQKHLDVAMRTPLPLTAYRVNPFGVTSEVDVVLDGEKHETEEETKSKEQQLKLMKTLQNTMVLGISTLFMKMRGTNTSTFRVERIRSGRKNP